MVPRGIVAAVLLVVGCGGDSGSGQGLGSSGFTSSTGSSTAATSTTSSGGDTGSGTSGTDPTTAGATTSASTGGGDTSGTGAGTTGLAGTGSGSGTTTGIDPNTDPLGDMGAVELVAGGFTFLEGPVWWADTSVLWFTDIDADTIYQWSAGDGVTTVESGTGSDVDGLTLDQNGYLVACEQANRRVTRRTGTGTEVIADQWQGTALNSPNDAVVRADGTVYFTDPTYGGNPPALGFQGVYRVDPQGTIDLVSNAHQQPNGIVLSPDADVLYVDDTPAGTLTAYPVAADGSTGVGMPISDAVPGGDGMTIDAVGNLYVSTTEGIVVLRPDGTAWGTIAIPEQPANCTFGDDDRRTLYVTARTSLYRVRLAVPGLPPP